MVSIRKTGHCAECKEIDLKLTCDFQMDGVNVYDLQCRHFMVCKHIQNEKRETNTMRCGECKHFVVDSNFSTDYCTKYSHSANSYDERDCGERKE